MTQEEAIGFLNRGGRAYTMWKHMMQAGEEYVKATLQRECHSPVSLRPSDGASRTPDRLGRDISASRYTLQLISLASVESQGDEVDAVGIGPRMCVARADGIAPQRRIRQNLGHIRWQGISLHV